MYKTSLMYLTWNQFDSRYVYLIILRTVLLLTCSISNSLFYLWIPERK